MRCGTLLHAAIAKPSSDGATRTLTVDGSRTGLANVTDQSNASPRAAPTVARASDAVSMPWAIARGKPKALAASDETWIGLRSPDTPAYRRPVSAVSVHRPVGVGGSNGAERSSAP